MYTPSPGRKVWQGLLVSEDHVFSPVDHMLQQFLYITSQHTELFTQGPICSPNPGMEGLEMSVGMG